MTAKRAGLIAIVSVALYMLFLGSIAETAITPAPDFPNYYYAARNLTAGSSVYADFADQMLAEFGVADINYFADPPRWLCWSTRFDTSHTQPASGC
ncbi:MAG: hypothetical protein JJE47_02450 [Acidimicrobiia bacterium]|nr:hypothetical protein [Acidimicrobiia bacterium]